MNTLALLFITFYQRHLSRHKGFRCAHAAYFGGPSCSHAVHRIVLERGLLGGWEAIRQRFAECRFAALELAGGGAGGRSRRRRTPRRGRFWDAADCACDGLDFCDGPGRSCDCTPWN